MAKLPSPYLTLTRLKHARRAFLVISMLYAARVMVNYSLNAADIDRTMTLNSLPDPHEVRKQSGRKNHPPPQLVLVGSDYGGWTYDASKLTPKSIVYSIGLGEDTSWDEGIMKKHKLNVWGFDPTPKSLEYVAKREELKVDGLFHLTAEGLATFKGNLTFTKPKAERRDQVSLRAGKFSGMGGTINVPVNTLENWMERNSHRHLDILKMDVEGSEYDVLEDWIRRDFFPFDQLLIEWHFRFLHNKSRHDAVLRGLKQKGWKLVDSKHQGQENTFVRSSS